MRKLLHYLLFMQKLYRLINFKLNKIIQNNFNVYLLCLYQERCTEVDEESAQLYAVHTVEATIDQGA